MAASNALMDAATGAAAGAGAVGLGEGVTAAGIGTAVAGVGRTVLPTNACPHASWRMPRLPISVPRVAESGVASAADASRVRAAGYDFALVGSALMRSRDPEALLAELLAAGRG